MKYYLDTNICIYFLKGMYPILLKKLMSKNPEDIKIAAMVKAELIYGAEKSKKYEENIEKIKCFLLPFEVISFDENAAVYYAKIRSVLEKTGGVIGPNDLIIAATVMSNKGTLITNNEKEFNRIDELEIENWIK